MFVIKKPVKDQDAIKFCTDFIESSRPKYILGRNEWAASIADKIKIDGVIDDYYEGDQFLGIPIVRAEQLEDDALLLVASVYRPKTAMKRAAQLCTSVLDYFSFYKYVGIDIKQVLYWDGFYEDFSTNRQKYNEIYSMLADDESKLHFSRILNFRLNYDIKEMSLFECNEKGQYFDDFLTFKEDEIFVDVGGFDGGTTAEFIKRCPNYKAIYFFEPEIANLEIAKNKLRSSNSIKFYPLGLYSQKASLSFASSGSASKISEDGNIQINVDALDNLLDEPVTFIKMDIEGTEIEAIKGAQALIKKYKPRLAISAYHKPDDFWRIPEAVLAIRNDYKIYMRHYMEGVTETVLFFI